MVSATGNSSCSSSSTTTTGRSFPTQTSVSYGIGAEVEVVALLAIRGEHGEYGHCPPSLGGNAYDLGVLGHFLGRLVHTTVDIVIGPGASMHSIGAGRGCAEGAERCGSSSRMRFTNDSFTILPHCLAFGTLGQFGFVLGRCVDIVQTGPLAQ